jgi:hypothetical protein
MEHQHDDARTPDIDLGMDAQEAHRAAHATEPRMGNDGGFEDPDTIADAVVDPGGDNDESYVPSKPVPTEGQGGLP